MSQAENPHTTNLSRRTVLAGLSIAAAPAAVAVDKSRAAALYHTAVSLSSVRPDVDRRALMQNAHRIALPLERHQGRGFGSGV
jgi:hypothetical protein